MKRILACLAALALPAAAVAAEPTVTTTTVTTTTAAAYDPIGDVIAATAPPASDPASGLTLRASLYHGGHHMGGHDALGCRVAPMRTVAVDPAVVSHHSIIFIKETVGMRLPGGGLHDGYWYASDSGGAIKGARIDLFTGANAASMRAVMHLNLKALTVTKVGEFSGCPPVDGGESERLASAQ